MTNDPSHRAVGLHCPRPLSTHDCVQMAHGGGGRLSEQLLAEVFLPAFDHPELARRHDGALLQVGGERLAFTTDSFVVRPLFFPGGDIGSLAVHGTVNDLCMCGARPLYLSASYILEEGFELAQLERIVASMAQAARAAEVSVVTGDTKVVDRGKGDGVYINTSGVGRVAPGIAIGPEYVQPGDVVLINGEIATHGIAIMSVREGLQFETELVSDSAALGSLVGQLLDCAGNQLHFLRDPTRGGVASACCELAQTAGVGIRLDERRIPVADPVRGACELLGLDPLYVANEGKAMAVVAPQLADRALEAMRQHPLGARAAVIGEVTDEHPHQVVLRSSIGTTRIVAMLSGEQLPRIC